MAKVTRHTWEQSANQVIIHIPLKNASLLKPSALDFYASKTYVKLHVRSAKLFAEFDLHSDIDWNNPTTCYELSDDEVRIVLAKLEQGLEWEQLTETNKELAHDRRARSQEEVETAMKELEEQATKRKHQMDRHSTTSQMDLETYQRNLIEEKKTKERLKAEAEVYGSLPTTLPELVDEDREVPEVRQPLTQTISFTAKKVPFLPARESTGKEPPMPKPLKPLDGPLEDAHPTWLKDRGDDFFTKEDYGSAVNAYSQAISKDDRYLVAILNRSAALIKQGNFEAALTDLRAVERQAEDEKMLAAVAVRRGAIDAWSGNYREAIESYNKAKSLYGSDFGFSTDVALIEQRTRSDALKAQGDELFRKNEAEASVERYLAALEEEPENEIALANLAQAYLNLGKDRECLEACDKALGLITFNNELKIKVLLRKTRCLQDSPEALQSVRFAQSLDPQNEAVLKLLKKLEACESERVFVAKKEEADTLLRSGHFKAALEIYRAASKMTRVRDKKAAVLANMAVCHLNLNSLEDVVSVSTRGLKLMPEESIALRLYMRRAKAYAGIGQKHAAISDLRRALELKPDDTTIQSDLAKLQA